MPMMNSDPMQQSQNYGDNKYVPEKDMMAGFRPAEVPTSFVDFPRSATQNNT